MNNMYYSNLNNDLDVAISTNITLLRNLASYPFPNKMDEVQIGAATEEIIEGLFKEGNLSHENFEIISSYKITEKQKDWLLNSGIISQNFANNKSETTLILANDKTVGITLCDNNHIQINSSFKGSDLETAHKIINTIDNIICGEFLMAFDNSLGFLTESLTDLGTGMKASVTLFLPALETAGTVSEIAETVAKIGLSLDRIGNSENSLFTLTNCITMGITSNEAISNLLAICNQIIDKERYYRMQLLGDSIDADYIKAKSLLLDSDELSYKKAINLLYRLRLCSSMGVGRQSLKKVSELIDDLVLNGLQLSGEQRAEYLKNKLA